MKRGNFAIQFSTNFKISFDLELKLWNHPEKQQTTTTHFEKKRKLKTPEINPKAMWIKLVHFINPSRFYFRDLANAEEERQQVETVESSIFEFVKKFSESYKDSLRFYEPKSGEVSYCDGLPLFKS